jgi:hypothetical protein
MIVAATKTDTYLLVKKKKPGARATVGVPYQFDEALWILTERRDTAEHAGRQAALRANRVRRRWFSVVLAVSGSLPQLDDRLTCNRLARDPR